MNLLTAANIGSAVRWVLTSVGSFAVAQGIGTAADWTTIASGGVVVATLIWSLIANKKKVA